LPRDESKWIAGGGRDGIFMAPRNTSVFHDFSEESDGPRFTSGIDGGTMRALGTLSIITVHWPHMTVPRLSAAKV
jgi:hypothetical protein